MTGPDPARPLVSVALLCLTVLSGCAAPGPWRAARVEEVETRHVQLQGGFLFLELKIPIQPPGPKPAVIGPFGDERPLLERGIVVVCYRNDWESLRGLRCGDEPDTEGADPAGGNPVGSWLLASPRPGVIGRSYLRLVGFGAQTTIPAIVDHLSSVPEIDPARIAVAGSSTRGFVALEALVAEPRLGAAAVRVACGDYHEFLRSSSLGLAGDERWLEDGELVLDPDYEEELRAREPIRHPELFPPRPLLLLAGARDPVIPAACAVRTARILKRAYAERGVPERFRFVLYPGAGHDLGRAELRETLTWWDRWLLDSSAPPDPPTDR